MKKHSSLRFTAGIIICAMGFSQIAAAATVQVVGSFNDATASEYFFFNRTYNQDNDLNPGTSLPSNLQSSTDAVSYFGWGIDQRASFYNHQIIQSHFWFNGTGSVDGVTPTTISYGEAFSLGSFTYTNQPTVLSGGMVEIDFRMDIQLNGMGLLPVEYRIGIDNTYNASNPSSDTATLLSGPQNIAFAMDGADYLLTFHGFSRDSGLTFETFATLPEGEQTTAQIYASISALTPVPVPAALWLFGSGLIGLAGLARRKKD
jgi:hypothetical protein